MRIPDDLQPLVDDGVIDEVIRPLKSGKEASVYVVRVGDDILCAKVYKNMAQRSFQARSQYQEGRQVRGSRQQRAVNRASKFGKREQEKAWKNTEVDALYQLDDAGIRVPKPRGYFQGVLLMELIVDDEGHSAPRLGEVALSVEQATEYHARLIGDVQLMLCLGLIHGDLSKYNVLVSPDGPVIIDLPQMVSASGNNAARQMLLRDVNNLRDCLSRSAPALKESYFGEEMWALYELGELQPDTVLSGQFAFDQRRADVQAVMESIIDAKQVALIRQQGREAAEEED